jgi:hypothetical protein
MYLHHEVIEDMQDLGIFSGSVDSGLGSKLLKIGEVKILDVSKRLGCGRRLSTP